MAKHRFYAVRRGRATGVFSTWDECKAQVDGFANARFKGFATREAAESFIAPGGNRRERSDDDDPLPPRPPGPSSTSHSEPRYYAVVRGNVCGVMTDADELRRAIDGHPDPFHREFDTKQAAEEFLNEQVFGAVDPPTQVTPSRSAPVAGRTPARNREDDHQGSTPRVLSVGAPAPEEYAPPGTSTFVVVYADGACPGNGAGADRGGCGVFFGVGDDRNIACRLPNSAFHEPTNNRSELYAALLAQLAVPFSQKLELRLDSKYVAEGMRDNLQAWVARGWKLANGSPVKNMDLWEICLSLMKLRGKSNIKLVYVPGHAGVAGNEGADTLANRGLETPWESVLPPRRDILSSPEECANVTNRLRLRNVRIPSAFLCAEGQVLMHTPYTMKHEATKSLRHYEKKCVIGKERLQPKPCAVLEPLVALWLRQPGIEAATAPFV